MHIYQHDVILVTCEFPGVQLRLQLLYQYYVVGLKLYKVRIYACELIINVFKTNRLTIETKQ